MFNNQSLFDRRMIVRMDKVPEDSAPPGPKLPSESLYLLYSPPHRCQFVSNPQLNPCSPPHRCQFVSIPQLKALGSPSVGEGRARYSCSPPLYVLSYLCLQMRCYPSLWQRLELFKDLNDGVCHVMKITSSK